MATKAQIDLLVNTAESANSLKEFRQNIRNIQTAITEATDPADVQRLQRALALARDASVDFNERLRLIGQNRFERLQTLGQNVAAGFQVATGAIGLFGTESEKLNEIANKANALFAVFGGLGQLSESTRQLKDMAVAFGFVSKAKQADTAITTLNTAAGASNTTGIISNTTGTVVNTGATEVNTTAQRANMLARMGLVGAIIAVTGAIIYGVMKIMDNTEKTKDLNKALEDQEGLLGRVRARTNEYIQSQIALAEAQGRTADAEAMKKTLANSEKIMAVDKATADFRARLRSDEGKNLLRLTEEQMEDYIKEVVNGNMTVAQRYQAHNDFLIRTNGSANNKQLALLTEYINDVSVANQVANANEQTNQIKNNKQAVQNQQEKNEKLKAAKQQEFQDKLKALKDSEELELLSFKTTEEREMMRPEITRKFLAKQYELYEQYGQSTVDLQKKELEEQQKFNDKQAQFVEERKTIEDKAREDREKKEDERIKADGERAKKEGEILKESADNIVQNTKARTEAIDKEFKKIQQFLTPKQIEEFFGMSVNAQEKFIKEILAAVNTFYETTSKLGLGRNAVNLITGLEKGEDGTYSSEQIIKGLQELGNFSAGIIQQMSAMRIENLNNERNDQLTILEEQEAKRLRNVEKGSEQEAKIKEDFEKKRDKINQEFAKRERQLRKENALFEADLRIFNIIADTAAGIAANLKNPFMIGLIATLGAVQLGIGVAQRDAIAKQKAERGGFLKGPLHGEGGIMLTDTIEGQGGEFIINRESTMKFADTIQSINQNGGDALLAELRAMRNELTNPIRSYVVFEDIEKAGDQREFIRRRTEF